MSNNASFKKMGRYGRSNNDNTLDARSFKAMNTLLKKIEIYRNNF